MEEKFVHWLREHVATDARFPLGLGDDAAVLAAGTVSSLVITTDLLSDGIDFHVAEVDPRRVGRKALAVNLSDLAAMAAQPTAVVVSMALPHAGAGSRSALELAIEVFAGLLPLAAEFDVAIAGGDTNTHDGPLVISITALGQVAPGGPLTRRGGQPGDRLLVTGQLGGSIRGHHFDFTPRVREATLLAERYELHAGIDISDGLALDLARLAEASNCGAVLNLNAIPISHAARELALCRADVNVDAAALDHALGDGEDFELLLAVPADVAERMLDDQPLACPLTEIGAMIDQAGLWQQTSAGHRVRLAPTGWQHGR